MPVKHDRWYLKEVLDLEQLKKLFKHFSIITNIDVALFDFAGREILAVRKENSVCQFAKNGPKCREHISSGSLRASELGEPYISACGCGLIMCFSPIMYKERLIGSIACGPTVLWDADEVAMKEFMEKTKDMGIHVDIGELFHSITSCTCTNMTSSAQILFIIVNSLTKEHSVYLNQRARITEQQAKIAELIIGQKNAAGTKLKKEIRSTGPGYPIEREKELIVCVQNGNIEQSKKILNILLGEIFSFADGNLDAIRVRLFELNAFFSRAAVETGAPMSDINEIAVNSFNIIHDDLDFGQICFLASQTMEEFVRLIGRNRTQKKISEYLSRAVDYMALNYTEELTLRKVADAVFISSFYLSHLFRKEMNTTFSDHLCKIRIDNAKAFLKNERNPRIQEIAEKTGFNDPNYFAKSFKKMVGIAPREYKNFFR
ncbi:MAG: PocR ligand-binding domain-containing protein [Treponema sp.]|nr:PocR ligand-binding domain-containing protein [Treponema sp.]